MSLQAGTIVRYTPGNDGASYPAIVFREWQEGTIELHVFHFDAGAHVRAAHPSQVEVMIDPALIAVIATSYGHLVQRVHAVEEAFDALKPILERLRELTGDAEPRPEPDPARASVESTPAVQEEAEPDIWKKKKGQK